MAVNTRKRSAFNVFKSSNATKDCLFGIASNPSIAAAVSEYEEQRKLMKTSKQHRRGSLSSVVREAKDENPSTPPYNIKQAKRSNTCKSEPRLNSLRKSFKRKKNEQQKETVAISSGAKGGAKLQSSTSASMLLDSDETNMQSAKLLASSSTFGNNRSSMYHVQVSSTESLQSLDDNVTKNEFIQPDEAIAWLIKPVDTTKFFKEVWEKKPLLLKRRQTKYNDGWFSTKEFDDILREKDVKYGMNLDITKYVNGKRETLNPTGRAYPAVVWDFYQQGCSIRMLNPQAFSRSVWKLTSILQEYFGSFVGANMYLTPPGSQGFAPHYDDIEAFIIQLEGKKRWKLYTPRNVTEVLPRFSSCNFSEHEIGEPIFDKVLEPGDCMYFPRGYIHQANTLDESHSLHITLSVYQRTSWGDFLEKLLPQALQVAMEEDVDFRRGLPIGYLKHVGVCKAEKASAERSEFLKKIQQLIMKLANFAPVDAAADEMSVGMIQDMLPPLFTADELMCTVHGNGAFWDNGCVRGEANIQPESEVRLIKPNCIRLTCDSEGGMIYHAIENSRSYHETPAQMINISAEEIEATQCIIDSYPSYVTVKDIPLKTVEKKVNFLTLLYNHGVIRTKLPLIQDSMV